MQQISQISEVINLTYTKRKIHSKLTICPLGTCHFGNVCWIVKFSVDTFHYNWVQQEEKKRMKKYTGVCVFDLLIYLYEYMCPHHK